MNIEESINKIKEVIYMSDGTKVDYIDINHMDLGGEVSVDVFIEAIETLLTAYEKEKRLAEANLKDSEEFQDNMCNHRCILNSKVEELETELEKEKEKNKELESDIQQKNFEIKCLNSDIKNMYCEEGVIAILEDNFDLTREEAIQILGEE